MTGMGRPTDAAHTVHSSGLGETCTEVDRAAQKGLALHRCVQPSAGTRKTCKSVDRMWIVPGVTVFLLCWRDDLDNNYQ